MIWFGTIISIAYWLLAAVLDTIISKTSSFAEKVFVPGPYEMGMRSFVVVLVNVMCAYFRVRIRHQQKLEHELDKEYGLNLSTLDAIGSLVVVFDTNGKIVRFNRACEQITGYTFDDIREKNFWKLFSDPFEVVLVKEALTKLVKGNFPKEYENTWVTAHSKKLLIKWSNTVVSDKSGTGKYVISVGVDITEHQRAQIVLEESAKEYKDLMENIGIGISLVSSDRKVLYTNSQMRKWFSPQDFSKRSMCHNILSNFSQEACSQCPTCRALGDGKVHELTMSVNREENVATYRVVAFPVEKKGSVIAAVETVQDFTEIDAQQHELRHSYLTQAVMNSLLRFSLENITFEGFLKCALSVISSIPCFSSIAMGAIYLTEQDPGVLRLKVHSNFPDWMQKAYSQIKFGKYACGRVASKGEAQFTTQFGDYKPEGGQGAESYVYYCVPIIYSGNILGVLTIGLDKSHRRDGREEELLTAIANSLAGVIQRKKVEQQLGKINQCFVNLSVNSSDNIKRLVSLCGEVLGATSVFYNRLDLSLEKYRY